MSQQGQSLSNCDVRVTSVHPSISDMTRLRMQAGWRDGRLTNDEQFNSAGVDLSWTTLLQLLSNLSIQPERTLRNSRAASPGNVNSWLIPILRVFSLASDFRMACKLIQGGK